MDEKEEQLINEIVKRINKEGNLKKEKELRQEILQKVSEIYRLRKENEEFIPGKSRVNYSGRVFDEKEIQALVNSSLDFWLTLGPECREFEKRMANYLGIKNFIVCNSGSSANLLAVSALCSNMIDNPLKSGDEVITTAATFPTTLAPIIQNNLIPVFVDIRLGDYNIDVSKIEQAISYKTRAIIFAHTLGNPAEIDKIMEIARKYNLYVIEDNCDALDSKYNGQLTGTFGDISTYSFYAAHHMSCSKNTCIPYLDEKGLWKLDTIERIYKKYYNKPNQIKVLSFNKNNKTMWSTPSAILRHKLGDKKMFKIISQHGRNVEITEDHSIFVLDKNTGNIIPKNSKNIKENDYIIVTNNIPQPQEIKFIDIIEDFKDKNAYVSNFSHSNLKYVKNADYRWQFKVRNSLPIEYLKDYNLEKEKLIVGISQSDKIPAVIRINEELCRFIGYFIAEGSYSDGLIFSLNINERDITEDIADISKRLFNISPSIYIREKDSSLSIKISSKNLEIVFKDIFGIKSGAINKRIPWFLYHQNEDYIKSFIYGFTKGDGSIRRLKNNTNKIDVTCISKDLINDLQFLLSRVGISGGFYRRNTESLRNFKGIQSLGKENYTLAFGGYDYDDIKKTIIKTNLKNRSLVSDQIPLLDIFREYICVNKKQKIISKKRLIKYIGANPKLKDLLNGDLDFLKVRKIEEINYNPDEYVYDFSVPEKENFYGGFLGIFMHNTMGEGGGMATNNPNIARAIISLRDWGRDCFCQTGEKNPNGACNNRFNHKFPLLPDGYDHKYVYSNTGYNLKPLDLQCAIGLEQLKKLPEFSRKRKENFKKLYETFLQYQDKIILPSWSEKTDVSWFAFPITIKEGAGFKREDIVRFLESKNIETRMLFGGNILRQPGFSNIQKRIVGDLINTDIVLNNTFFLGVFPGITEEKMKYMIDCINEFFKKFI